MKILHVLNVMIANSSKISDVVRLENEIFFCYDQKYKWAIEKVEDEERYYVHFYLADEYSFQEFISVVESGRSVEYREYSTDELTSDEALQAFSEIYQIVLDKLFGLDEVFTAIIEDAVNK